MYDEVRDNEINDGSQSLVCVAPACKAGRVTCGRIPLLSLKTYNSGSPKSESSDLFERCILI